MLKETPRSLRQYFTLISIIAALPFVLDAFQGRWSALASVSSAIDLCFEGLFIYIAIRFYALLKKPTLILVVLPAGMVSMLVTYALQFWREGFKIQPVATVVISLLVYWYLIRSVVRLSREPLEQNA